MRRSLTSYLLILVFLAVFPAGCSRKDAGRFVVVISLDTLRADHLGCYGYGRRTSPVIDRFAREEAVVFERAFAQAPYTLPSHMSMLTALYPEAHGVLMPVDNDGIVCLSEKVTTLAEAMQAAGFATAGFTDGLLLDDQYGFGDGFDQYEDQRFDDYSRNGFRKYGDRLHAYVDAQAGDDTFLFIHTYDVHGPFEAPAEYRDRFRGTPPGRAFEDRALLGTSVLQRQHYMKLEQYGMLSDLIDRYDATIAFVDDELGKLFDLMKKRGIWDDAMVVITSDHGENFLDRGLAIGHGFFATNEEARIPLLIKFPGGRFAGTRSAAVVESVDIMPTVLAQEGLTFPRDIDGQDLAAGLETNEFRKRHAYGLSPSAGGMRYFIKDDIKFVERMRVSKHDVRSYFLPHLLRPIDGEGRPYEILGKKLRYDFDRDPLGILEDLYYEPRVFDLSDTLFEWQATEIRDESVLREYSELAEAVSIMAARKGATYGPRGGDSQESLSPEQMERLASLGYVEFAGQVQGQSTGIGAEDGEADEVDDRAGTPFDPAYLDSVVLPRRFKASELTLMEKGDRAVWSLWRMSKGATAMASREERHAIAVGARAAYVDLRELRPDREDAIGWRLRMVDLLLERLDGERGKK